MKKTLFAIIAACSMLAGCISPKKELNMTAAYPFEGRYDSKVKIAINDNICKINKDDSIWILSNRTIYNLLVDVSDDPDKIIFNKEKANKINEFNNKLIKKFIKYKESSKDDFLSEEYIWDIEEWNQSETEVKF